MNIIIILLQENVYKNVRINIKISFTFSQKNIK